MTKIVNFGSIIGSSRDAVHTVKEAAKDLKSSASHGLDHLGGLTKRAGQCLNISPRQSLAALKQKMAEVKQDASAFKNEVRQEAQFLKNDVAREFGQVKQNVKDLKDGMKEFGSYLRHGEQEKPGTDSPNPNVPARQPRRGKLSSEPPSGLKQDENPNPNVPAYQPRRGKLSSEPPSERKQNESPNPNVPAYQPRRGKLSSELPQSGPSTGGVQPFMPGTPITADPLPIGAMDLPERAALLAEIGLSNTFKATPQHIAEGLRAAPEGRARLVGELRSAIEDVGVASKQAMRRAGENSPAAELIGDASGRLMDELKASMQTVNRLLAADIPDAQRVQCEQLLGVNMLGYSGAYIDSLSGNAEWLGSMNPELDKLDKAISDQYRKMSRQFHPDKAAISGLSPDDAKQKFQDLKGARDTLVNMVDGMRAHIELHKTGTVSSQG